MGQHEDSLGAKERIIKDQLGNVNLLHPACPEAPAGDISGATATIEARVNVEPSFTTTTHHHPNINTPIYI